MGGSTGAPRRKLEMGNTFKNRPGGVKVISSKEIMESKEPIQEIEISKIKAPKFHDRKSYSKENIIELAKNIQANKDGKLLQPIIVRVLEDGSLERIVGFRRIEAYKYLGRTKIEAKVLTDVSDEEALLIMLSENIQREDPNFYDQTVGIMDYIGIALNKDFEEVKKLLYHFRNIDSDRIAASDEMQTTRDTIEAITKKLGKISVSTMINRLKIFAFKEPVLEALQNGDISYNAGVEINKASTIEQMKELIALVKSGNLSVKGIKEFLQKEKEETKKPHTPVAFKVNRDGGKINIAIDELTDTQLKKLEKFLAKL